MTRIRSSLLSILYMARQSPDRSLKWAGMPLIGSMLPSGANGSKAIFLSLSIMRWETLRGILDRILVASLLKANLYTG